MSLEIKELNKKIKELNLKKKELKETMIKTCKTCGSTENKFSPNRYVCVKCTSKKYRKPDYHKQYYELNSDVIKAQSKKNYDIKMIIKKEKII